MTTTLKPSAPAAPAPAPAQPHRTAARRSAARLTRAAPTLVAAVLAAAYVIVSPPSVDLAAHLYRAHLFSRQGFGIWDDFWYSGHHLPGYSVLFPAVSAALSPQLAAALAAVATAALFESLVHRHFGDRGLAGAILLGAATAINLYTGRLALAFGALPALGAIVALDRRRTAPACGLALLAALCSPVAALFAAIAAAGKAVSAASTHRGARAAARGTAVAAAALAPVGLLALAFPEGGTEPFGAATLIPVVVIALVALLALPRTATALKATVALYLLVTIAAYVVPSPLGSNVARLGTFAAAPLAALVWWRRRTRLLALALLPLLYVGWQAPVADVATASGDPSTTAAYYQPLLRFLAAQRGPFRVEIPFTRAHWEANNVARHFPLARGWERQLDRADNPIFYRPGLTASGYAAWLHANAVRFVAVPDVALDYSAQAEAAVIAGRPPYLRPVMRSAHWTVYAVTDPAPLATGAGASVTAIGSDWLTLRVRRAGTVTVRVRYTPYWALTSGDGCVAPAGADTRVTVRGAGSYRLGIRFALGRIAARSPRCG